MAQHMRRHARRVEAGIQRDLLQQQRKALPRHRLARVTSRKQPRTEILGTTPADPKPFPSTHRFPSTHISASRRLRRIRQRHDPLLAALAADQQDRRIPSQRAPPQHQQLGHSQPRGVQDLQRRARQPPLLTCPRRTCRQQRINLHFRQVFRQRPGQTRTVQQRRRIIRPHALAQQKPKELPQRR